MEKKRGVPDVSERTKNVFKKIACHLTFIILHDLFSKHVQAVGIQGFFEVLHATGKIYKILEVAGKLWKILYVAGKF